MSTIKSSTEHLTLNADGAGKAIKFQANGVEKASIDSSGNFTSTSIDATKLSGALPAIDGANLTGIETVTKSTTAPTSPAQGDMWFNTSTSSVGGIASKCMASYSGTEWLQMSNKFSATGGTESTYSSGGINYKAHTFTSSGTFTANGPGSIDVLIVAGGGGGGFGFNVSGAGGAGGLLEGTISVSASTYSIVVGAGGDVTANGANSSGFGATANGGGHGGAGDQNLGGTLYGAVGGSGGSSMYTRSSGAGNQGNSGGLTGYGNAAGTGGAVGNGHPAGGGGGAGAVGTSPATNTTPGDGGNGRQNAYRTGSNIYYAGGGGGGAWASMSRRANGGLGGGGYGGNNSGHGVGTAGSANTGGGGGGSGSGAQPPQAGGSGIVVVRYVV